MQWLEWPLHVRGWQQAATKLVLLQWLSIPSFFLVLYSVEDSHSAGRLRFCLPLQQKGIEFDSNRSPQVGCSVSFAFWWQLFLTWRIWFVAARTMHGNKGHPPLGDPKKKFLLIAPKDLRAITLSFACGDRKAKFGSKTFCSLIILRRKWTSVAYSWYLVKFIKGP